MAKLPRYTQKVFASGATSGQLKQFGSLAAGAPANAVTPADVQALSNYLTGWFGAVIGTNSPAIEDMNSLCYLYGYQLAYLMQQGVAEWDAGTTYYVGSVAQDGAGKIYQSLQNNNLNNVLTATSFWQQIVPVNLAGGAPSVTGILPIANVGISAPTVQKFLTGTSTYTRPTPAPLYLRVRMVGGGGGGGASGTGSYGTAATAGGASTFGTSLLAANGGNFGSPGGAGGQGGLAFLGGAMGLANQGSGGGASGEQLSSTSVEISGGTGGASALGGGAPGAGSVGTSAYANTGGGGSGAGFGSVSGICASGAGGGSGGFVDAILISPLASYAYSVGAGGTNQTAGTSGFASGSGGSGIIIVEEFYQ